ncbi:peroxidase family protein [Tabrizicola sp.]|uniref:peroxidase family protein n=1 Tax=Tabrizicola sp. TaxID=2005166 RepID=UPI003F38AF23
MPPMRTAHNLLPSARARSRRKADNSAPALQSDYCYLFEGLANEPLAGCVSNTSEAETFRRLLMLEKASRIALSDAPVLLMRLPPAYTYFGQFVNHDISAPVGDVVAGRSRARPTGIIAAVDPPGLDRDHRATSDTLLHHLVNEHAAPLSLASLYGDGPGSNDPDVRALYAKDGKRFRLGKTTRSPDKVFTDQMKDPAEVHFATGARDIPRRNRKPLIADQRNDENLIISQLHLAMMLFHNKVVAHLERSIPDPAECFHEARQLVTLHYHWLILNDYLPSLLSKSVLETPLAERNQRLPKANTVPLEFTTAAFRFGHSMVGEAYDFNDNFGIGGKISPDGASLKELFDFTSHRNMQTSGRKTQPLPDHWVIDWDRMTRPAAPDGGMGGAEKIDMTFAPDMLTIVGDSSAVLHGSILFRNLMRGFHRRIPTGQRLAAEYGVRPLNANELLKALPEHQKSPPGEDGFRTTAEKLGFLQDTPAWLYFMCESKARERGERVGPTASHIIADTIVGLMRHNPNSVLCHDGGGWHPRDSALAAAGAGALTTIRDFLLFAVKDTATRPRRRTPVP